MHGRRQFVPQGVLLSQITNETLTPNCQYILRDISYIRGTASAKLEEGEVNGRSVCPDSLGLHARYKGQDKGIRPREGKVILKPARSSD